MSVREYVGARYVPIIDGEWDNTKTYEPLVVVTNNGNSYISRQYVPTGIEITNTQYWVLSANYNAQVEAYRQEVQDYSNIVANLIVDTVADMKAATTVRENDIVKTLGFATKGKGGAFYVISNSGTANDMDVILLNNGLFANLIDGDTLIAEQYGANPTTDSSAILQYVINKGIDSEKNVICDNVLIENTVTVSYASGKSFNVYCNHVTYEGTSYAFIITGVGIKFTVNCLNSNGYGIQLNKLGMSSIHATRINCLNYAIDFAGETYDIELVSTICVSRSDHAIYISTSTSFNGQINIHDSRIMATADSKYAIYCTGTASSLTGLALNNVSFESSKNGFYCDISTIEFLKFDNIRVTELTNQVLESEVAGIAFNISAYNLENISGYINFDRCYKKSIVINNMLTLKPFPFNGLFIDNDTGSQYSGCRVAHGKYNMVPLTSGFAGDTTQLSYYQVAAINMNGLTEYDVDLAAYFESASPLFPRKIIFWNMNGTEATIRLKDSGNTLYSQSDSYRLEINLRYIQNFISGLNLLNISGTGFTGMHNESVNLYKDRSV